MMTPNKKLAEQPNMDLGFGRNGCLPALSLLPKSILGIPLDALLLTKIISTINKRVTEHWVFG
jgi:hypothetical protein